MISRALMALAFVTASSATLTCVADSPVQGTGPTIEEARAGRDFERIRAGGPFQLNITRADGYRVKVSGDHNLVPLVRTKVTGRELVISLTRTISPEAPLVVSVSLPGLTALSLGGALSADIDAFGGDEMQLRVDGSSRARTGDFQYARLSADVSGSSTLDLTGRADMARISASGSSTINGDAFTAESAVIRVEGASSMKLGPSASIRGTVSGASTLRYAGSPDSAAGVEVAWPSSSIHFVSR